MTTPPLNNASPVVSPILTIQEGTTDGLSEVGTTGSPSATRIPIEKVLAGKVRAQLPEGQLEIYSRKLPRFTHDLGTSINPIVLKLTLLQEDFPVHSRMLGDYLQKVSEFVEVDLKAWEEIAEKKGEPKEVLVSLTKKGQELQTKLEDLLGFLMRDLKQNGIDDTYIIEAVTKIVNGSLRNFNETATASDYRGIPEVVNPSEIISSTIDSLRPSVSDYLDITFSGDKEALVFMDPTNLAFITGNLVMNAARAMQQNGLANVPYNISLTRSIENNSLIIRFEDKGPGIPPHILERITSGEEVSGTPGADKGGVAGRNRGFGMQNCIRYVGAVDKAKLSIDSTVGKGTTVTIEIPICEKPLEGSRNLDIRLTRASEVVTTSERRPSDSGPLRVLLVDSDTSFVDMAVMVLGAKLEKAGVAGKVQIEIATTKDEAIDKINSGPYHLVLCDPLLGKDSGLDIKKEMEGALGIRGTRFCILSTQPLNRAQRHFPGFDVNDILMKSLGNERLEEIIISLARMQKVE